MFTKKISVDPDRLYVCLIGHVQKAGSFPTGEKLRGSHPAVKAHPELFMEDGLSDAEQQAIWAERFPGTPLRGGTVAAASHP